MSIPLLCLNSAFAQVVNPGGGVNWYTEVPGLTNELRYTITNMVNGGDTGSPTGAVIRTGEREFEIQFPQVAENAFTNNINGSFNIDPSGTTTVTYLPGFSFPSLPNVGLTIRDTNVTTLIAPVILDLTTNDFTVKFVSSGDVVTNEYLIDYRANYGLSYGVAGDIGTISELLDGTNVYRRDGTYPLTADGDAGGNSWTNLGGLRLESGALANSWLSGDALGNASWQQRTIANLIDYSEIIVRDGSHSMAANLNMGGQDIVNLDDIYSDDCLFTKGYLRYGTPPPSGYTILSGSGGQMIWTSKKFAEDWWQYTAGGTVNLGAHNLTGGGTLGANSLSIGAGGAAISGTLLVSGKTDFDVTGGSQANPDVDIDGVSRHRSLSYFDYGIFSSQGNPAWYNVAYYAGNSSIICAEGDIVAGDAAWLAANVPSLGAPWGNVIAQNKVYCVDVITSGPKSFRIPHPVNTNKWLYHASVESPEVELLYRGKTTLVAGTADVNLNTYYGLIPNTLDTILTNLSVCVYNNASFTRVRCSSVSGVDFTILAEDAGCTDEVEWIVIGRRCDSGVASYQIEVDK